MGKYKTEKVGFVLSKTEKCALIQLAEDEGLSQAAFIRQLIRQAAKAKGFWPPHSNEIVQVKQYGKYRYSLAG